MLGMTVIHNDMHTLQQFSNLHVGLGFFFRAFYVGLTYCVFYVLI